MAGPITISILANAKPAVQGMRQVEQSATGMGSRLGRVGAGVAATFATVGPAVAIGAAVGFKAVIDQAASLSAALGTTKSIFGKSAQSMIDWSKTASTTLGLSQAEALNATKVFGGFFTGVGMGAKEAATMSKNWTTMAANMAAFGDIPVADSLEAVKSALIGEYDPIQKLIPTISAASLQQKAMELSGKKNAKALTDQDKAAALNAIMLDSMANKVGAAERAQGGYAVQMDKLKAQMKDAGAAIGGFFLPALTKGMDYVNTTAMPALKNLAKEFGPKLKAGFDAIGGFKPPAAIVNVAQSKEVSSIFTNAKSGLASLQPMFSKMSATIMPIILSVGATLGKAFTKALPQIKAIMGTIGTIVGQGFEYVRAQVSLVVTVIQFLWRQFGANILGYLSTAFSGVVSVLQGAFNIIKGIFDVLIGVLTGDWGRAWDGIKTILSGAWTFILGIFNIFKAQVTLLGQVAKTILIGAWNAIKAATIATWGAIKGALAAVWNAIKAAMSATWEAIKAATAAVWNGIKAFFTLWWTGVKQIVTGGGNAIKSAFTAAWNAVKTATTAAWNALKTAVTSGISSIVSTVKELGSKVKNAVSGAATWLVDAGRDLIQGMINGVAKMAGALADKARAVVSGAIKAAKGALGISSPSKVFMRIGEMAVAGLINGLATGKDDIARTVEKLAATVVAAFPTSIKKTFAKGTKQSVIDAWKKAEAAAAKKRATTKNALLARIKADNVKLLGLAARRDAIADKLKAANDNLADLQQARAGVVSSVAGAFEATFKLVNDSAEAGMASIGDVIQRSRDALAQAKLFAVQLKGLAAKGVASEILQELAMAGPKAGLDTARALMEGSADQLKELNANYAQIAATGKAAGDVVAGHMYDTGIAAAKSLADGFASQQAYLEASILQMIANLNKTIADAIKAVKKPATKAVKKPATKRPTSAAATTTISRVATAVPARAVPIVPAPPVNVTVNTGVIVDKRALVETVANAFNEVSAQLGRPIKMAINP